MSSRESRRSLGRCVAAPKPLRDCLPGPGAPENRDRESRPGEDQVFRATCVASSGDASPLVRADRFQAMTCFGIDAADAHLNQFRSSRKAP
jgi:hypothetical protein